MMWLRPPLYIVIFQYLVNQ
uniref:Uncharacterized protein n=1 Tax=Rhizophora mucronata TaxID=61149 RepID=A0A2P2LVX6_RHIMU